MNASLPHHHRWLQILIAILVGFAAILFWPGCTTPQHPTQHDMTCDSALAAYVVYQAIIMHDGQPSKDQIVTAKVAAEYLWLYCGYSFLQGRSDANGVPRITNVKR